MPHDMPKRNVTAWVLSFIDYLLGVEIQNIGDTEPDAPLDAIAAQFFVDYPRAETHRTVIVAFCGRLQVGKKTAIGTLQAYNAFPNINEELKQFREDYNLPLADWGGKVEDTSRFGFVKIQ